MYSDLCRAAHTRRAHPALPRPAPGDLAASGRQHPQSRHGPEDVHRRGQLLAAGHPLLHAGRAGHGEDRHYRGDSRLCKFHHRLGARRPGLHGRAGRHTHGRHLRLLQRRCLRARRHLPARAQEGRLRGRLGLGHRGLGRRHRPHHTAEHNHDSLRQRHRSGHRQAVRRRNTPGRAAGHMLHGHRRHLRQEAQHPQDPLPGPQARRQDLRQGHLGACSCPS